MSSGPSGGYIDPPGELSESGQASAGRGFVVRPPAPGGESAGPALSELVAETRRAADSLAALYRQARFEAKVRYITGVVYGNTDGSGVAALQLFQVPQGATGHLLLVALDEAGVTPAAPDTNANLWHALYQVSSGGTPTAAQVARLGALLDCAPQTPTVDAQIPFVYNYGQTATSPTLVGPGSFWLVVNGATAARELAARFAVVLEQPEP